MVTFLKWETRLCQLSIRRIAAHFDDCKQLKLKKGHLYSGFRENSPLMHSEWHVCFGQYSFSRPTEGRRLSWPEWLVTCIPRWYARSKTVTHPNINRAIVRRPVIELTTIESQVRRSDH